VSVGTQLLPSPQTEPLEVANARLLGWKGFAYTVLLGCAINILAYGFQYGRDNHFFELAMVNWLRDPGLYPGDPIREGFARFPTIFWKIVASVPQRIDIEWTLAFFFLLTKILFFAGVVRIVRWSTSDMRFARIVVVLFALSPALNARAPFGGAYVLDPTQTHTPLAIALLVCAGAALLEGRWVAASAIGAVALYFSAPYAIYMLFAFAALAVLDWSAKKANIIAAGFVGVVLSVPFVVINHAHVTGKFPADYIQALLFFYPAHLTLGGHRLIPVLAGLAFLAATMGAVVWMHLRGASCDRHLEVMTVSFVIPVLVGALAGQFFLTPQIANFQLMRADAFLLLYSALLLLVSIYYLRRDGLLPFPAVSLPLAVLFFAAPRDWPRLALLALGLSLALWSELRKWITTARRWLRNRRLRPSMSRGIEAGVGLIIVMLCGAIFFLAARSWSGRERFSIPSQREDAWMGLQRWARLNTPEDAVFLVPTDVEGFRVSSRRSSWGEWKDGMAVYLYPPFADVYLERMREVGWQAPPDLRVPGVLRQQYESQPWESLLSIAHRNHLQFIVQYTEVRYPVQPVYSNPEFSVYGVGASR